MEQMTSSSASDAVSAYLNDHLAGSAAGIQLAQRIARGTTDDRLEAMLRRFVQVFDEDRRVLETIMERNGIARDRAKQVVALGGEWVGRLKHVAPMLRSGSETLVALEDVELLSLGIEGRTMLLRALRGMTSLDVGDVDLATLEERARRQREELEPFRLRFVQAATSPSAA